MNILVDTSAMYAMADSTDGNNQIALQVWARLLEEADLIVTSSYALSETISLLHARAGTSVVRAFVETVLPAIEVDWTDQDTNDAALRMMLETEGKKGPSLTDCANLETMRRLRIHTIFAYDKHYERPGITVIGAAD